MQGLASASREGRMQGQDDSPYLGCFWRSWITTSSLPEPVLFLPRVAAFADAACEAGLDFHQRLPLSSSFLRHFPSLDLPKSLLPFFRR
jgi:hypothetical protein